MPKDINLKDLEVGDTVAYSVLSYKSAHLRVGTVVDLPERYVRYAADHVYIKPIAKGNGSLFKASNTVALVEKGNQPPVYHNTPTVVCVIVPLGAGGVLAVRRANDPGKGKLGLPGGYQMAGETWQMAGVREVAEETGFILYPEELEMVSMATDEYGNNLVIAEYAGTSTDYVISKETDGEATEVVRVTKDTPEDEWAFPRHGEAVADYDL